MKWHWKLWFFWCLHSLTFEMFKQFYLLPFKISKLGMTYCTEWKSKFGVSHLLLFNLQRVGSRNALPLLISSKSIKIQFRKYRDPVLHKFWSFTSHAIFCWKLQWTYPLNEYILLRIFLIFHALKISKFSWRKLMLYLFLFKQTKSWKCKPEFF